MIAYGIRWPSIAADSEMLRRRIAGELLRRSLKARLEHIFEGTATDSESPTPQRRAAA